MLLAEKVPSAIAAILADIAVPSVPSESDGSNCIAAISSLAVKAASADCNVSVVPAPSAVAECYNTKPELCSCFNNTSLLAPKAI